MIPQQVIRRPIVTEKSNIAREEGNFVTFAVDPRANKHEIAHAVESLFDVKVLGVRAIHRGGARSIHRFELPEGFDGDIMIEADVWEDRRKLKVPFEATVSVGLGRAG